MKSTLKDSGRVCTYLGTRLLAILLTILSALAVTQTAAVAADNDAPVAVTVSAVDTQLSDTAKILPATDDSPADAPRDPSQGVDLDGLAISLPGADASDNAVVRDGVSIYTNDSANTAVAVNPTAGGVQLLVSIGDAASPRTYPFPIDGAADVKVLDDGTAVAYTADGTPVASVAKPWATDADGTPVPTHFETDGGTLVQVVDHAAADVQYPVLADPSVFLCDHWSHVCVKFNRSETSSISRYASPGIVGAAAWAGMLCSKLPSGIAAGACVVIVAGYSYALSRSFDSAASNGRCVELHFGLSVVNAVGSFWWKTEGC